MKRLLSALFLVTSLATAPAQTRTVTKVLTFPSAGYTNFFSIGSNEVAAVAYCRAPQGLDVRLYCTKDDLTFGANEGGIAAGPAAFTMISLSGSGAVPVTFEVTPQVQTFPPEKTVIVPEASTGAFITMELSTNLMQWMTVTNGFYTGTNGAKFLRIRADRIL